MGTGYTIAEIVVYPVKGCRGVSVPSAAISFTGLHSQLCIPAFIFPAWFAAWFEV